MGPDSKNQILNKGIPLNSTEIKKRFLARLAVLNQLQFPKDQYVIWGSGPLAIRGLRDARDIDLVVTDAFWQKLIDQYPVSGPKKNKITIGEIDIWQDLLNLTDKIHEIISNSEFIEGFPFMSLFWTIEWKKYWNSKKDPTDIQLIQKHIFKEKSY